MGDSVFPPGKLAGGPGPAITVAAADAAVYASDQRQGQFVVQVVRGEKLTELQALLIPPATTSPACWPAGRRARKRRSWRR